MTDLRQKIQGTVKKLGPPYATLVQQYWMISVEGHRLVDELVKIAHEYGDEEWSKGYAQAVNQENGLSKLERIRAVIERTDKSDNLARIEEIKSILDEPTPVQADKLKDGFRKCDSCLSSGSACMGCEKEKPTNYHNDKDGTYPYCEDCAKGIKPLNQEDLEERVEKIVGLDLTEEILSLIKNRETAARKEELERLKKDSHLNPRDTSESKNGWEIHDRGFNTAIMYLDRHLEARLEELK